MAMNVSRPQFRNRPTAKCGKPKLCKIYSNQIFKKIKRKNAQPAAKVEQACSLCPLASFTQVGGNGGLTLSDNGGSKADRQ